jgi:hypothetical protein
MVSPSIPPLYHAAYWRVNTGQEKKRSPLITGGGEPKVQASSSAFAESCVLTVDGPEAEAHPVKNDAQTPTMPPESEQPLINYETTGLDLIR